MVEVCRSLQYESFSDRHAQLISEVVGSEIPFKAEDLTLGQVHNFIADGGDDNILEDVL